MLHLVSGKWIFKDNDLFYRVRFVENGKPGSVLAASPFSRDIANALRVR